MTNFSQLSNNQFILRQRPSGLPKESDWQQVKTAVKAPEKGKVLVAVTFISVDPAMRSWMNEGKSYMEAIAIGDVMQAAGAGLVLQSDDARFSVGDAVLGAFGVQEFATMDPDDLTKIDISNVPATAYMGALGTPGFTAYFGLLEIGKVRFGETVLVSGAAGAVGSVVGQIAKIKGCRVVGIAGAQKNALTSSTTWGLMLRSTTSSPTHVLSCQKHARKVSTFTSTMWAAKYSIWLLVAFAAVRVLWFVGLSRNTTTWPVAADPKTTCLCL